MPFFGVPIRNGVPIGLGSVAGFGISPFDPSQLFSAGEQGAWYDPSDLSTMFNDAAGTQPITSFTTNQPVGLLLDKSKGLVLGPELVTNGDFSSGTTGWAITIGTGTFVSSSGVGVLTRTGTSYTSATTAITTVIGRSYKVFGTLTASDGTPAVIAKSDSAITINSNRVNIYGGSSGTATPGTGSVLFTATATTTYIHLFLVNTGSGSITCSFDNISVRELPGNHATASGSARPVLSKRYNLLTYSEEFDNGAWTKVQSTISANAVVAPNGTLTGDKLIENTATASHDTRQTVSVSAVSYVFSVYVQPAERTKVLIGDLNKNLFATFTLSGSGTVDSQTGGTGTIERIAGSSWYRVAISGISAAGSRPFGIRLLDASGADNYTGTGTSGIYIWGADLRRTIDANAFQPAYQRVVTATDYDGDGFLPYLEFGGTQLMTLDSLVSGTSYFEGANAPFTMFAGATRYTNTTFSRIVVLAGATSATATENDKIDLLYAQSPTFATQIIGSVADFDVSLTDKVVDAGTNSAPKTNVVTWDRTATNGVVRVDGAAGTPADQTQPALSLDLATIGASRRGSVPTISSHLDGRMYSLIIRGAQSSDAQISATEAWINQRTGAF